MVETPWAADGDDAGGDFDLVAELSEVFDVPEPAEGLGLAGGTEEEGFEQVFAAFKQGVENALSDTDFEARYDLGIAYREMGLLDDAIQEFGAAMGAEARRLPCLHMMGLCALDLGRGVDAVAHLEQALALPELPTDQRVALRFDLGRAYVAVGDVERARSAFEEVQAEDPDFQGVGDLLAGLEQPGSGEGPEAAAQLEPAEAFENFDEFMLDDSGLSDAPAEASDEAEARPPVAHDSEDATARLEETVLPPAAAGGSEEAVPDPADAAQPVPSDREEASASPEPGGRRPGRRRKKISFV